MMKFVYNGKREEKEEVKKMKSLIAYHLYSIFYKVDKLSTTQQHTNGVFKDS